MVGKSYINPYGLTLGGCILSAALVWASPVKAQVSLSPLIIEINANRGQGQATINVSNSTNQPFRARVYAEPFTYDRDKGFQSLKSSPNALNPYLQFSPRELIIPPGVTRNVRLITRFPPNLPEGEYRSVIFTENLNETKDREGNNVTIQTRIGVTVYVRQGNLSPKLAVESAGWNPEKKQVQVLVKNTGKASARPSIKWTLKQGEKVVKTGEADAAGVIAQSDRYILLNYPTKGGSALTAGEYQLSGELLWGENNNNKQPFTVNLTIPAQAASK